MTAPLLVIAVGNPSRGDDALGPALLDALQAEGAARGGAVELMTDFQLQVEHALDLAGRRAVLFVDAAMPGHVHGAALRPLPAPLPGGRLAPASHALHPQAVLQVGLGLGGEVPPAWQLAIEGQAFELGDPLSAAAQDHLQLALALARGWLAGHAVAA